MQLMSSLLIMSVLLMVVAGCETTRGAGKDIENTGQNIQDTVNKND